MRSKASLSNLGAKAAVALLYLVAVVSNALADDVAPGVSRTIAAVNTESSLEQDGATVPLPIPALTSTPSEDRSLQDALPPIANACGPLCCGDLLSAAPNLIGGNFGAGSGNIDFANIPHTTVAKLVMPNAAESVLGRQTIGDDSSPMPRDRCFFDYDYFYRAIFSPNGDTVDRFVAGLEKTFFDGRVSAEVRVPFGTTLDNDVLVKSGKVVHGITHWNYRTGEETLLGNVAVGAKALLWRIPDTLAVSAGVLVTVPTANDLSVTGLLAPLHASSATLQIKNEAVHLAPYLGAVDAYGPSVFSGLFPNRFRRERTRRRPRQRTDFD